MGLVTCSKCKKIYDYDKYNGICPKCARYNSNSTAAEEHQEFHDKYDGGYNHSAQNDHHVYHQKYDDNKNPHKGYTLEEQSGKKKMDKRTAIILGVLLFVFLFNLILPVFGVLYIPVMIGVLIYILRRGKNNRK